MSERLKRTLLALGGLALLTLALWRVDLAEVARGARALGWRLPVFVLVPSIATLLTFAAGLSLATPRDGVGYREWIRLHALTQGGNELFGGTGELLKLRALLESLTPDRALALLLRAHWLNGLTLPLFFCITVGAAPLSADRLVIVIGAMAIFSAALLLGLLMAARRPLGRRIAVRACQKLFPSGDGEALANELAMLSLTSTRSLATLIAFLTPRLVAATEAYALFRFLGTPCSFPVALFGQCAVELGAAALSAIPGSVGVAESAAVLVFAPLGVAPASGVLLALVRRVRQVSWIAITAGAMTIGALPGTRSETAVAATE